MNQRLKTLLIASAMLLLSGCSTVVKTPQTSLVSSNEALTSWARVLNDFVNDAGETDFVGLAQDRSDLDLYIRYVADTPLDTVPGTSNQLAHMINAYNALSMFNVIESGFPASHAGWAKVKFFLLRKHTIGGASWSLYGFENDVIRPFARSLKDPQVHFALNCSAVACPVLPRTPFTGSTLHAELERETRAFFAQPRNFRIDHDSKTLWLSEILKFYPEDFVPLVADSLMAYANRYAPQVAPLDYTVRFTPYDWTVSHQRPHLRSNRTP